MRDRERATERECRKREKERERMNAERERKREMVSWHYGIPGEKCNLIIII